MVNNCPVQSDFNTSVYTSQSEICDSKEVPDQCKDEEPHYLTMASIMTIIDKQKSSHGKFLS